MLGYRQRILRPKRIPLADGRVITHVYFEHWVPELRTHCFLRVHWTHAFKYLRSAKRADDVKMVEWESVAPTTPIPSFAHWRRAPSSDRYTILVGASDVPVLVEEEVEA